MGNALDLAGAQMDIKFFLLRRPERPERLMERTSGAPAMAWAHGLKVSQCKQGLRTLMIWHFHFALRINIIKLLILFLPSQIIRHLCPA